jgi:hypothetical protein
LNFIVELVVSELATGRIKPVDERDGLNAHASGWSGPSFRAGNNSLRYVAQLFWPDPVVSFRVGGIGVRH